MSPAGCSLVVAAPPSLPFCVSRFSLLPLRALFFSLSSSCVRPRCVWLSLVSSPGCPGPWRCVLFLLWASRCPALGALSSCVCVPPGRWLLPGGYCPPPPPPFVSRCFCRCCSVICSFFFPFVVRPRCLWLSLVSGPRCPGPRRCALFALLASCFSAPRALSPLSCFPPGRWLLPGGCCPPFTLLCLALFVAAAGCCVPCAVLCCVSLGAVLRRAAARFAARCCAVVCCVVFLRSFGATACCAVPSSAARCPAALSFAALCFAVFPRAVCSVLCVFCRGVVVCAVVRRCALCCVCPGMLSLSGRVVCFPVAGVVCCGALLPCVVFCGAVLSRGAVQLCSAVLLRCCWCLLCPPVACCAVLCRAVGWLCFFLPGGGVRVLWCSFPPAVCSLSSAPYALRCLAVLAVVPCFSVSCAVALCCLVVLCCRVLLSFCGAICASFALLWPVVWRRAVRCCAVGCRCCFLPGGGVCVLWCPFRPCRHAQKTSIITLSYPASVSLSVVHVVEESGLFVRRCRLVCRRLS